MISNLWLDAYSESSKLLVVRVKEYATVGHITQPKVMKDAGLTISFCFWERILVYWGWRATENMGLGGLLGATVLGRNRSCWRERLRDVWEGGWEARIPYGTRLEVVNYTGGVGGWSLCGRCLCRGSGPGGGYAATQAVHVSHRGRRPGPLQIRRG